ncbi:MAG: hypothetical protein MUC43_11165 [Pirellula sp.]|jgi:hypothetical protein|nr:hypothetical protein [Pirellula sp.]
MKRTTLTATALTALSFLAWSLTWSGSFPIGAQEPTTPSTKPAPPIADFEEYLTGAVLTGVFTVDGQSLDKLEPESYEIKSAKKLDGYDSVWEITTRIKYGKNDIEVPVEINVEWVGKTPIMVMDSAPIPGLGTFSARVVFHDKKYAGTWKHDDKGGHLFGRVEKKEAK